MAEQRCPGCGSTISEMASFCSGCGASRAAIATAPFVEQPFAPLAARASAKALDALPLLIAVPLAYAFAHRFPGPQNAPSPDIQAGENFGRALAMIAIFFVAPVQFLFVALSTFILGATPGKALLRLRVVTRRHEPAGAIQTGFRGLVELLSFSFCFSGYALARFGRRRRALHDWLGATEVITLGPPEEASLSARRLIAGGALLLLSLVGGLFGWTALRSAELWHRGLVQLALILCAVAAAVALTFLLRGALRPRIPRALCLLLTLAPGGWWLWRYAVDPPNPPPPAEREFRDPKGRYSLRPAENALALTKENQQLVLKKSGRTLSQRMLSLLDNPHVGVLVLNYVDDRPNGHYFSVILTRGPTPPPNAAHLAEFRDSALKELRKSSDDPVSEALYAEVVDNLPSYFMRSRYTMRANELHPAIVMIQIHHVVPGRYENYDFACGGRESERAEIDVECKRLLATFRVYDRPVAIEPEIWLMAFFAYAAQILLAFVLCFDRYE